MVERDQQDRDSGQGRSEAPERTDFGRSPWWSASKRRPLRRRPLDRHRAHEIEIESSEAEVAVRELDAPPAEPEPFATERTSRRRSV